MAHDLDIGLLRAFGAVVDTGGVTQASRLLHQTQAAVSLKIKRLEDQLQVQLFERAGRKMLLTSAGERFVPLARRLVAANDETWVEMVTPQFEGEVRLGVPHDILGSLMPPILRRFNHGLPRVRVSLVSTTSRELLDLMDRGEIELTLTTEFEPGPDQSFLTSDPLVWVGAADGEAHLRRPLPVTVGGKHCLFRQPAIDALSRIGRDWRLICESSNMATMCATVEADMAIAPLMPRTIPESLHILGEDVGLPLLPPVFINLRLPPTPLSDVTIELAKHIRQGFQARYPPAVPSVLAASSG